MRRLESPGRVLALAWLLLAALPAPAGPDCARTYAIGDLHGGDDAFVEMLTELGLVDDTLAWNGGDDCLVQTGDVLDRGADSRRILDLLMRLHEESDGRVVMLLGNHEVMNMVGDLRYVSAGEFAAFADNETAAERKDGFATFLATAAGTGIEPAAARDRFDQTYPPGWFAHRRAFSPEGRYGSWLLERPVVATIGATLFVHGGLTRADAARRPDELSARVHAEIREYDRLRTRLIAAGWLDSLTPFAESVGVVGARLEKAAQTNGIDLEVLQDARRFRALCLDATATRADGPVWNRDLARADEVEYADELDAVLRAAGVARIVVGHTTTRDGHVASRFRNRVFMIDTGAGPAYEGRISALEITREGQVSAVYLGEREVFVEAPRDESAIERVLRDGTVLESGEIGSGRTRPLRLTLEHDGVRMHAAFKYVDEHRVETARKRSREAELIFTDSFRYERAAYLLDRWLGLGMVPVAVLRTVGDVEGAAIEWIEDATDAATGEPASAAPRDVENMARQRAVMRLFDALIANDDRSPGNQLVTPDGRLHLIDHSRAFRERRTLPDDFTDTPVTLPCWLLPRLEALDRPTLGRLFDDLLVGRQKKALLARRDALLEKIAADRRRYGDVMVFFTEKARGVPVEATTTD